MLMAGVLNSEVEKFCGASYRGRRWGSKATRLFLMNAPAAISRSQRGRDPHWRAGWPEIPPPVTKMEKPSEIPLARSGKRV